MRSPGLAPCGVTYGRRVNRGAPRVLADGRAVPHDPTSDAGTRFSRRSALKGMATAGMAGAMAVGSTEAASASPPNASGRWSKFDAALREEFARQGLVGGAVALVSKTGRL
jgi:hypothetical protein